MRLIRTEEGLFTSGRAFALRTHEQTPDCAKHGCVIHAPTETSIAFIENWPLNWREDRGFMEVICPHGVGHPTLDQKNYWLRTLPHNDAIAQMIHGCDGCHDYDTAALQGES